MNDSNVSGSVQPKTTKTGKTYLYTVIYVPSLGKQKWESTGLEAKGNIRRAEAILEERINKYRKQEYELYTQKKDKNSNEIKFVDWVIRFVEDEKANIRNSTAESYVYRLKYIVDYFSDKNIVLSEISAMDIDGFVKYMLLHGKKDGSGLAVRTVRSIKTIIVSALNKAVLMGYINGNVALSVRVGKKSNASLARKLNFMTIDELNDFLKYLHNTSDEMEDIIKVMAFYGLRRSEALGLYLGRDSVDLENRRLHISRTVVKVGSIHDEEDTKSQDSHREFYISNEMYEFFQRVLRKKEENRTFYGEHYHESKSLFTWSDGKEFSPDYLYHHFAKIMKKYGRSNFTLHSLRHSAASYLVGLGWSETDIASWLGHSNYATTHKWYVVISQAYKQKKAQSLDGKLNIL